MKSFNAFTQLKSSIVCSNLPINRHQLPLRRTHHTPLTITKFTALPPSIFSLYILYILFGYIISVENFWATCVVSLEKIFCTPVNILVEFLALSSVFFYLYLQRVFPPKKFGVIFIIFINFSLSLVELITLPHSVPLQIGTRAMIVQPRYFF